MVIDDLDLVRPPVAPDEADPPLVVDSNAVLSRPVAAQHFQMVTGRRTKVGQGASCIQIVQPAKCGLGDVAETSALAGAEQGLRMLACKRPNHTRNVIRVTYYSKKIALLSPSPPSGESDCVARSSSLFDFGIVLCDQSVEVDQ